jgi:hypothetical protein
LHRRERCDSRRRGGTRVTLHHLGRSATAVTVDLGREKGEEAKGFLPPFLFCAEDFRRSHFLDFTE